MLELLLYIPSPVDLLTRDHDEHKTDEVPCFYRLNNIVKVFHISKNGWSQPLNKLNSDIAKSIKKQRTTNDISSIFDRYFPKYERTSRDANKDQNRKSNGKYGPKHLWEKDEAYKKKSMS